MMNFILFYRNYNPEGRKDHISREEAIEELIDAVIFFQLIYFKIYNWFVIIYFQIIEV